MKLRISPAGFRRWLHQETFRKTENHTGAAGTGYQVPGTAAQFLSSGVPGTWYVALSGCPVRHVVAGPFASSYRYPYRYRNGTGTRYLGTRGTRVPVPEVYLAVPGTGYGYKSTADPQSPGFDGAPQTFVKLLLDHVNAGIKVVRLPFSESQQVPGTRTGYINCKVYRYRYRYLVQVPGSFHIRQGLSYRVYYGTM